MQFPNGGKKFVALRRYTAAGLRVHTAHIDIRITIVDDRLCSMFSVNRASLGLTLKKQSDTDPRRPENADIVFELKDPASAGKVITDDMNRHRKGAP